MAEKRIYKEFQTLSNTAGLDAFEVKFVEGDYKHWKAKILGPKGTCYEGGEFWLDILLTNNYPYKPPLIKFDTKI